jgi:hypothetical protein
VVPSSPLRRFLLLAVVAALAASPVGAERDPVDAGASPIRCVEPAAGVRLVAGEVAGISWEPVPGGSRLRFEEWEAFLSVDGGRSWPFRLTGHLDAGIREAAFRVPIVVSNEAFLLLRSGDERVERESAPIPIRIVSAGPAPASVALPSLGPGESARPGERGVLEWVDSPRDGRDHSLRQVADGGFGLDRVDSHDGRALPRTTPPPPPPIVPPPSDRPGFRSIAPVLRSFAALPLHSPVDVRLAIHRLNE